MALDDVRGELVATTRQRPFAAMLRLRADGFGVARQPIRAQVLVHLTLVVARFQLQLQPYRLHLVRMVLYPRRGRVEVDFADVKFCKGSALPQNSGIQRH